ncbi:hypothetical protein BC629DRAFT_1531678 [Irpex lacteus]|nr:hypothetical protein BC629DRAFT_1531678 [Irpex lacteus]
MQKVLDISTEVLRRLPAFKRISQHNIHKFIVDVYSVGLGIRTGFLFDTFSLSNKRGGTATALTEALCALRESMPTFQAVVLVHISTSDDFYFLNHELFLLRFSHIVGPGTDTRPFGSVDLSWVTMVSLTKEGPTISPTISDGVRVLLDTLGTSLITYRDSSTKNEPLIPLDVPSNSNTVITTSDFIPFAAILLEYPVAYAPMVELLDSSSLGFLSGVELVVYSCRLTWPSPHTHETNDASATSQTFMQFSCPSQFGDLDIASRLRERFGTRIAETGLQCELVITSRKEQWERVAL